MRGACVNMPKALQCCRLELGDDMAMRRYADMPMAALWTYDPAKIGPAPMSFADYEGSASVAHSTAGIWRRRSR